MLRHLINKGVKVILVSEIKKKKKEKDANWLTAGV